jgi:hypothetical protein
MTLGAPSLNSQYYFADGETGEGIQESYAIYNPTDAEVTVYAVFLGLPATPDFTNDTEVVVPKGRVVILDTADVPNLPAGRRRRSAGRGPPRLARARRSPAPPGSARRGHRVRRG